MNALSQYFLNKRPEGRIFISYRREDSQWAAGRLADSLSAYFGDDRVFRDIDGITGGEDFGKVIQEELETADAVIVLMGPQWLHVKNDSGERRLEDPNDWVGMEIKATLDKKIPIYPILIEGTPMPREQELPGALTSLCRYNALSISDNRWDSDVNRLARIVGLDIPSSTERILNGVNIIVTSAFFIALAYTVFVIFENSIDSDIDKSTNARLSIYQQLTLETPDTKVDGECLHKPQRELLKLWQGGINFVVVITASAALFYFARYVEAIRRRYFYASAWIGAVGAFFSYVIFKPICNEYEALVLFLFSNIIAILMLVLMCWSGFRAK